eukprot:2592996-Rhodomonas_salina.3
MGAATARQCSGTEITTVSSRLAAPPAPRSVADIACDLPTSVPAQPTSVPDIAYELRTSEPSFDQYLAWSASVPAHGGGGSAREEAVGSRLSAAPSVRLLSDTQYRASRSRRVAAYASAVPHSSAVPHTANTLPANHTLCHYCTAPPSPTAPYAISLPPTATRSSAQPDLVLPPASAVRGPRRAVLRGKQYKPHLGHPALSTTQQTKTFKFFPQTTQKQMKYVQRPEKGRRARAWRTTNRAPRRGPEKRL